MFRLISIFITLKFIPIAKVRMYQFILDASQTVSPKVLEFVSGISQPTELEVGKRSSYQNN